jgi:hypothetical protein
MNMSVTEMIELAALDDPFILAALREHMQRFAEHVVLETPTAEGWDTFVG